MQHDPTGAAKVLPLDHNKFGELAVDLALVTPAQLDEALRRQRANARKLGEIFEEMGVLPHAVVDATLCIQAHRRERFSRR